METKKINLTLLATSIILIALNLRIPITSVGPDIKMMQEQYALSDTLAGMVTTIPLLVFAVVSPLVSSFSEKYGYGKLLTLCLILILLGELIRSFLGEVGLFAGTFVIGFGIAVGNVLIPSVIKHRFEKKMGQMTSVYVSCMTLSAAVGVGATIPIAKHFGWSWQYALSLWAIFAMVALIFWIPFFNQRTIKQASELVADKKPIWRYPMAWWVSLFLGLQSIIFYALITWLPSMVVSKGMTNTFATEVTFILLLFTIPTSIFVPIFCSKLKSQSGLIAGICLFYILGLCLLLVAHTHISITWAVTLISLSTGGCLSAALLFFSLRSSSIKRTTEMSGLGQSVGYLLAAIGPLLVGYMRDYFNGWNEALCTLIVVAILLLFAGTMAGRDYKID